MYLEIISGITLVLDSLEKIVIFLHKHDRIEILTYISGTLNICMSSKIESQRLSVDTKLQTPNINEKSNMLQEILKLSVGLTFDSVEPLTVKLLRKQSFQKESSSFTIPGLRVLPGSSVKEFDDVKFVKSLCSLCGNIACLLSQNFRLPKQVISGIRLMEKIITTVEFFCPIADKLENLIFLVSFKYVRGGNCFTITSGGSKFIEKTEVINISTLQNFSKDMQLLIKKIIHQWHQYLSIHALINKPGDNVFGINF